MDKRFKSFGLDFTPEIGDLLYYQNGDSSEYYCIITYISKLNEPETIQIEWFGAAADALFPYKTESISFYEGSRFIKMG